MSREDNEILLEMQVNNTVTLFPNVQEGIQTQNVVVPSINERMRSSTTIWDDSDDEPLSNLLVNKKDIRNKAKMKEIVETNG